MLKIERKPTRGGWLKKAWREFRKWLEGPEKEVIPAAKPAVGQLIEDGSQGAKGVQDSKLDIIEKINEREKEIDSLLSNIKPDNEMTFQQNLMVEMLQLGLIKKAIKKDGSDPLKIVEKIKVDLEENLSKNLGTLPEDKIKLDIEATETVLSWIKGGRHNSNNETVLNRGVSKDVSEEEEPKSSPSPKPREVLSTIYRRVISGRIIFGYSQTRGSQSEGSGPTKSPSDPLKTSKGRGRSL
jgi:hypothetical protein